MKRPPKTEGRSCERFEPFLKAMCDGELRPELADAVALHVSGCASCRVELDDIRALASRLQRSVDGAPLRSPQAVAARAIEMARALDRGEVAAVRSLQKLALAAALLFVASLGLVLSSQGPSDQDPSGYRIAAGEGIEGVLELAINDPTWSEEF